MNRQQWEQELRNRQRNIVFPDTVRNQGNFYRTLLRSNAPLTGAPRLGLVLLGGAFFFGGCVGLAWSIAGFLSAGSPLNKWLLLLTRGGVSLGWCLFAALMLFRALLPPASPGARKVIRAKTGRVFRKSNT